MSRRTRHQLLVKLMGHWLDRLRLQTWTVHLTTNTDERKLNSGAEVGGTCMVQGSSQRADVTINWKTMENDDPRWARFILLHELVHLRWNLAASSVEALQDTGVFTPTTWEVFYLQWIDRLELCVDEQARAMLHAPGWLVEDTWFFDAWPKAKA